MTEMKDFWVGDRLVRPSLGEIQLGLERVHLEPRSMEVLLALARRPKEVIPKRELIEAVWGEAFVSDEVLTHAIWDLRRAFGDNASDPEFIQTVPKRGYRLIAPVKLIEQPRRRATDREPAGARWKPATRTLVWGLLALLAVLGTVFWLSRRPPAEPAPAVLVLMPTDPPSGQPDWGLRLDIRLRSELTGIDGIGIRRSPLCEAARDVERTWCLEPMLFSITDCHQLTLSLKEAGHGEAAYATPLTEIVSGDELDAAAADHAEQVTAWFGVQRHTFANDPDIRPWISTRRHDPRAILDFLLGVEFVYLNETGGRSPMDVAIERDPGFVAPLVWRTPTMVGETAAGLLPETELASHRDRLAGLYDEAIGFEKPMINWAIALIDGEVPAAIRELKVALGQEPENRPMSLMLGVLLMGSEAYDQAWEAFAPLLESRWRFPGLYSQAAQCALCRGRLDDLRATLAIAERLVPVDPEALALLGLLAARDGDRQKEAFYAAWLERRKVEMEPEVVEVDLLCSDRLRESAD